MNWIKRLFSKKKEKNKEESERENEEEFKYSNCYTSEEIYEDLETRKRNILNKNSQDKIIECGKKMRELHLTSSKTFKDKQKDLEKSEERDKLEKADKYFGKKYPGYLLINKKIGKTIGSRRKLKSVYARNYEDEIPCNVVGKIYEFEVDSEDEVHGILQPISRGGISGYYSIHDIKDTTHVRTVKYPPLILHVSTNSGIYLQPVIFQGEIFYLVIAKW